MGPRYALLRAKLLYLRTSLQPIAHVRLTLIALCHVFLHGKAPCWLVQYPISSS